MKNLLFCLLFTFTIFTFADQGKAYSKGKFDAYQLLKKDMNLFSTNEARELQGNQANVMHQLSFKASKTDPVLKNLLKNKEKAYKKSQQTGDRDAFYKAVSKLELHIVTFTKKDQSVDRYYKAWLEASKQLEDYRISQLHGKDKTELINIYTKLQTIRAE